MCDGKIQHSYRGEESRETIYIAWNGMKEYNFILYERRIIMRKTMCERSEIYCWFKVYIVGP